MTRHDVEPALVEALSRGMTYREAAKFAGCSESTVDRRMADPLFRDRVEAARDAQVSRVADRLTALSEAAMTALDDVLATGTPALRVRVALALPAMALAHRDAVALEARLEAMEAQLAEVLTKTNVRRIG